MAWRPTSLVVDGQLDNTTRDRVTGWIQLAGHPQRLQLDLQGNCHPDLAGWCFQIVRLEPVPDWEEVTSVPAGIAMNQLGRVGDITADMTVRHFDCSVEEFLNRQKLGEPVPEELRKCLYLEWYSQQNGRAVIQCTRLGVQRIGQRAFELTEDAFEQELNEKKQTHRKWLEQLGAIAADFAGDVEDEDDLQSQLDRQADALEEKIRRSLEE